MKTNITKKMMAGYWNIIGMRRKGAEGQDRCAAAGRWPQTRQLTLTVVWPCQPVAVLPCQHRPRHTILLSAHNTAFTHSLRGNCMHDDTLYSYEYETQTNLLPVLIHHWYKNLKFKTNEKQPSRLVLQKKIFIYTTSGLPQPARTVVNVNL